MSQIIIRYEIITSDNLRDYINSIHNNDNSYKQLLVNFNYSWGGTHPNYKSLKFIFLIYKR